MTSKWRRGEHLHASRSRGLARGSGGGVTSSAHAHRLQRRVAQGSAARCVLWEPPGRVGTTSGGDRYFWSDRCVCGDPEVTDCDCLSVLGHVWRHRRLSYVWLGRAMQEAYRCRPKSRAESREGTLDVHVTTR